MKKYAAFLRCTVVFALMTALLFTPFAGYAEPMETEIPFTIHAPSVMLLEADSGKVIFEKNADQKRPVASVTKMMTALILIEKLEKGEIGANEQVTVSEHAASAIGSQALLDAHAQYPVETLLQATVMASGNDSAIALAEYAAGTEEAFAELMNERAKELGMANTHYVNCTGLPAKGQYTTAQDVATLACALAGKELYHKYASVWMDELTHPSGRVTELTNTNRLVRFYQNCDGFKTGSTNEAKYCVCATAVRNGMRLIAVVLGAESSQSRFDEARSMLDYGFASYKLSVIGKGGEGLNVFVPVQLGLYDQVEAAFSKDVKLLVKSGANSKVTVETELCDRIQAPVEKGTVIGTVRILMDGKVVAQQDAVAKENVPLPGFLEGLKEIHENWH